MDQCLAVEILKYVFIFFDLALDIRSFALTNSRGAQALGKEFLANVLRLFKRRTLSPMVPRISLH
jgi:hypothetical protein